MSYEKRTNLVKYLKALTIAFSLISILLFFYQSIRNHNYIGGNDLTSYLNSSKWFFNFENPYTATVRRFIYPLFLIIVSYPLTFLQSDYIQKALTAAAWSAMAYLAFFKTIFTSWKYLEIGGESGTTAKDAVIKISLLVLLLHPFLQDEFLNGQVNLFVLGGIAGFFFMLEHKKQLAAALFLSIAVSLKIAPVICLLYALCMKQFRSIIYVALLVILFNLGIPLLINSQSLDYYTYFVTQVMPQITGSDFEGGFKSYSIVSTVSYLFGISWQPLLKITAIGLLTAALLLPAYLNFRRNSNTGDKIYRLLFFAVIISVIPLTFPMSETHHLLILTLPILLIIEYWRDQPGRMPNIFADRLSVWFIVSLATLHLGQVLKPTPLRLTGLLGIYFGLLILLSRTGKTPALAKK